MKRTILLLFCLAPFLAWCQSKIGEQTKIPNCGNQTPMVGAGCMLSSQYLITSSQLTEFADLNSIQIVITRGGKASTFDAKMISSNKKEGWCLLQIVDGDYNNRLELNYGFTDNPLKTAFYLGEGKSEVSVGKLVKTASGYQLQKSVTRDTFGLPLIGTGVIDNSGNLVGIVTGHSADGTKAEVLSMSSIRDDLKKYSIVLPKPRNGGNPSLIMKEVQPCMVKVKLNVYGSKYYPDYCENYYEGLSALDAKDYVRARFCFKKASNCIRKPSENDVAKKIALCDYWLYRTKGDEYAKQFNVELADRQYQLAYQEDIDWNLKSEVSRKRDALKIFQKNVALGDDYFSKKDYPNAYNAYLSASQAQIKPIDGSLELSQLEKRLKISRRRSASDSKHQFLMANASSENAFGITYGVSPHKTGWFINLMSTPNWNGLGSTLTTSSYGVTLDPSNVESNVHMFAQTGLFFRIGRILSWKLGAGYGVSSSYLRTTDGDWAKISSKGHEGLQLTTGLMLWTGPIVFSFDFNTYRKDNTSTVFEPQVGLGFRF